MTSRSLRARPRPQADVKRARLIALLGHPGERDALSCELATPIRARDRAREDPALLDHLRPSLVEALLINNARWLGEPEPGGVQAR